MKPHGDKFKVVASKDPWSFAIDIRMGVVKANGMTMAAKPIVVETVELNEPVQPCFNLRPDEAQAFMDSLWACGVRPTDGTGSNGQLQATKKHLDDMRKLAFRALGFDK